MNNLDKFWNGTLGAFWAKFSKDANEAPKTGILACGLVSDKSNKISYICSDSFGEMSDDQQSYLSEFVNSLFEGGGSPDHVFGTEMVFTSAKGFENLIAVWRDGDQYAFACNINDRNRLAILLGNVITGKLQKGDQDD